MRLLTNKDVKNFMVIVFSILVFFICVVQFLLVNIYGKFSAVILITTLFFGLCILWLCFSYFTKQQRTMERAEYIINDFLAGNTDARIDCNEEGSLFKLFHMVNTLATSLNALALKEMNNKEFLKNMISDISHQLKTPLSALYIYNELLRNESADEAAVIDFSVKSEQELNRIETLVQNLLKITKLDAGAISFKLENENIASLLKRTVQSFEARVTLEHKSIRLEGSDSDVLFCDGGWMLEAVSNIVKNALDHIDEWGEVFIRWQSLNAHTRIIIEDNGIGIKPEDIHHIFKRFYRSKSSKDKQGIGLGLSLANAIIKAHSGIITVESNSGKGSVFTIDFTHLTKL